MVSHHPGRFCGLKYCGSINIMKFNLSRYLARSRNQKRSTIGENSLTVSHDLARFRDYRHCNIGYIIIVVCKAISKGRVIKVTPSKKVTILPCLLAIITLVVGI